MAGYIGSKAVVASNGAERKKTYSITGTTTSLTGLSYTVNQVHVFHNGVRLVDGTDYTATDGSTITLTNAAQAGDEVVVISYAGYQVSDTVSASQGGTFNDDVAINGDLTVNDGSAYSSGVNGGSITLNGLDASSVNKDFAQISGLSVGNNTGDLSLQTLNAGTMTEAIRVSYNGNVGIGTTSPNDILHVVTPSFGGFTLECTGATADPTFKFLGDSGNYWSLQQDASQADSFQFRYNNSEKIRIDSSGNLLVSGTSTTAATDTSGSQIALMNNAGDNYVAISRSNTATSATCLILNRTATSDGTIQTFRKQGTTVGSIGTTSGTLHISGNSVQNTGIRFYNVGVAPCSGTGAYVDNSRDLGSGSVRWDDIYATNGSIQTSDEREKQDIRDIAEAEARVAQACKGLLKAYRWKDAVAEKGDDARIHFGIIAQDLQAAFAAEGLDAGDYAMFIHTTWWESTEIIPAVAEELDDEGNVITEAQPERTVTHTHETQEEAPEGAVQRDRMGVRYPELLAFIIGAM